MNTETSIDLLLCEGRTECAFSARLSEEDGEGVSKEKVRRAVNTNTAYQLTQTLTLVKKVRGWKRSSVALNRSIPELQLNPSGNSNGFCGLGASSLSTSQNR